MQQWTKEQKLIIESREGNLLVAAAAGSGKTAVLVERIITIITDTKKPVDIDKLLVVTFTNAAAKEMKERVKVAIERKLQIDYNNKQLQRQLSLMDSAQITTIHSFCLDLLKKYYFLIGLDPDFKIGTEYELGILKAEALSRTLEDMYIKHNKYYKTLIDFYGGEKNDFTIETLINSLYNFVIASPNPKKWLKESADEFNVNDSFNFLKTKAGESYLESVRLDIEGAINNMKIVVENTSSIIELATYNNKYREDYNLLNILLESLKKVNTWDELAKAFLPFYFQDMRQGVARIPRDCGEDIKTIHSVSKDIRDECKSKIQDIRQTIISRTDLDIIEEFKIAYPAMKGLSMATTLFIEKYGEMKTEKNLLDFNDIEHYTFKLLTTDKGKEHKPSKLAKEIQKNYYEIFIDEYQDSNIVQEILLSSIAKDNRFMVGDIKQSIYKFRHARPDIFLNKYNNYDLDLGKPNKKILLHKNFRSRPEVLYAANYVFENAMSPYIGGIEYGESEKLNPGLTFNDSNNDSTQIRAAELHLIDFSTVPKNNLVNLDEEETNTIQKEAIAIGNIIIDLFDPTTNGGVYQVIDKKSNEHRNIELKDIAILLRSTSSSQYIFTKELNRMGIDVSTDSSTSFIKSYEIVMLTNFLKVIVDKNSDINLLGLLKSPLYKFTPDDLNIIRLEDMNAPIYDNLQKKSEEASDIGLKCRYFLEQMKYFSELLRYEKINELIWRIAIDSGLYFHISMLNNGEARTNNIHLFTKRLEEMDMSTRESIVSFLYVIDNLFEANLDMSSSKLESEESDAVKIMTIHKSKGLEFPIVICGGLGRNFNNLDLKNNVIYHTDLGYGPQLVDRKNKISTQSIQKEALKKHINIENLSEEMRILYVALTRAKEKLILVGTDKNLDKNLIKWNIQAIAPGPLTKQYSGQANNYLDWIVPVLLKHPDIQGVRNEKGLEGEFSSLDKQLSSWTCKIWSNEEIRDDKILMSNTDKIKECAIDEVKENTDSLQLKKANIYIKDVEIQKTSAPSTLQDTIENGIVNEMKQPRFVNKEHTELDGREKGIQIHYFMKNLDFSKTTSVEDLDLQLRNMIKRKILKEDEVSFINLKPIHTFLNSELGIRMKNSQVIKKEQAVTGIINLNDVHPDIKLDNTILSQGYIDIYFEENNKIILIDYKSEYISTEDYTNLIDRHKLQLRAYKEILEAKTGKIVAESYLALLYNGKYVKIH